MKYIISKFTSGLIFLTIAGYFLLNYLDISTRLSERCYINKEGLLLYFLFIENLLLAVLLKIWFKPPQKTKHLIYLHILMILLGVLYVSYLYFDITRNGIFMACE